jgi:hypothetical protein
MYSSGIFILTGAAAEVVMRTISIGLGKHVPYAAVNDQAVKS